MNAAPGRNSPSSRPEARRDPAFGEDRQHPSTLEDAKRGAGGLEVAAVTVHRDAADQLAGGVNQRPVVVFLGDHEAQHAPAARLEHQMVDPAGVVRDQDRRARLGQRRPAVGLQAMHQPAIAQDEPVEEGEPAVDLGLGLARGPDSDGQECAWQAEQEDGKREQDQGIHVGPIVGRRERGQGGQGTPASVAAGYRITGRGRGQGRENRNKRRDVMRSSRASGRTSGGAASRLASDGEDASEGRDRPDRDGRRAREPPPGGSRLR